MGANFTIQILPTVLQNVFYELCSLTLRTIFDLRIPGATIPIRSLLSLSSDSVPSILVNLKINVKIIFFRILVAPLLMHQVLYSPKALAVLKANC